MPHPGPVATGALQPVPHCDQASIPGASQEKGSMATPGPGGGFHLSSGHPARCTERRLYSEVIKKNRDAPCGRMQRGEGMARGLFFFSIQDTLRWGGGLSCVCLSVCGSVCVSEDTKRGVHGSVFITMPTQAWDPGPHSWKFPSCTWASRPARAGAGGVKALLPEVASSKDGFSSSL